MELRVTVSFPCWRGQYVTMADLRCFRWDMFAAYRSWKKGYPFFLAWSELNYPRHIMGGGCPVFHLVFPLTGPLSSSLTCRKGWASIASESTQLKFSVTPPFATQHWHLNSSDCVIIMWHQLALYLRPTVSGYFRGHPGNQKSKMGEAFVEDCIPSPILHSLR